MDRKKFPVLWVILIWFLLAFLAVLNGTFRVYVLIPIIGEYSGHVASSIILSAIIVCVAYFFINERKTQIKIGLTWLCMTITFEFLFGHFVMNHPWEKLFHDYNIMDGRVWIIVLVTTFFAPLLASKILERLHN